MVLLSANHRYHPTNFLKNSIRLCLYVTVSKLLLQASEGQRKEKLLEQTMGKVFLILSISLDGYVAGPNDEIEPLHNSLFGGDTPSRHGHGLTLSAASREVLDEALEETGACVAGRKTYDVSGGWGGEPPYPVPYFIVSHDVPPEMSWTRSISTSCPCFSARESGCSTISATSASIWSAPAWWRRQRA